MIRELFCVFSQLVELPFSFCELSDDLKLSIARNPLERPSVEQSRMGINGIRRFFGYNKPTRGAASDSEIQIELHLDIQNVEASRPKGRDGAGLSRHDWAGPASLNLVFNCFNCAWKWDLQGESDKVGPEEEFELTAAFNFQTVGKIRAAKNSDETLSDRVTFTNRWLPWHSSDPSVGDQTIVVTFPYRLKGGAKDHQARLRLRPWLAYACSTGARLKTPEGAFGTVSSIHDDDTIEVLFDNNVDDIVREHEARKLEPPPVEEVPQEDHVESKPLLEQLREIIAANAKNVHDVSTIDDQALAHPY